MLSLYYQTYMIARYGWMTDTSTARWEYPTFKILPQAIGDGAKIIRIQYPVERHARFRHRHSS
jgi:hypothetical protein